MSTVLEQKSKKSMKVDKVYTSNTCRFMEQRRTEFLNILSIALKCSAVTDLA